jgi:long-chain acyl-CoA synthetase
MLLDKFAAVAAIHSERVAIVSEQREIRYGELVARARAVSHALARETGPSATLGLCILHPIDFMVAYLAAAGAGRRIVLLDPRLKAEEMRALTQACEVTQLLYAEAERAVTARLDIVVAEARGLGEGLVTAPLQPSWQGEGDHYLEGDFVVHTSSGSMGKPKGIVCSQEQIWHRIASWIKTVDLGVEDVVLCTLTLSHCHGIDMLMLPPLFVGAKVIAPELARISPRRVVTLWDQHKVTIFSSLPYMYEMILESVPASKARLDSLRYIISASAPLSDATAMRFRQVYGRSLNQAYGMSEIGCILLLKEQNGTLGSAGDFVAGVEGRLVTEPGQDMAELVVRGKGLARGYLDSPQAQELMFHDGWLWTQDLVMPDAHGYAIKGRRSRFINVGGNKVDPTEIEHACATHPQVQDVAVVGLEDPLFGQRVVAVIKAAGGSPTSAAIHTHLAASLASHKLPSHYLFVEDIPRTGLGKIQLDVVRQLAAKAGALG